jgi:hypothetical protein
MECFVASAVEASCCSALMPMLDQVAKAWDEGVGNRPSGYGNCPNAKMPSECKAKAGTFKPVLPPLGRGVVAIIAIVLGGLLLVVVGVVVYKLAAPSGSAAAQSASQAQAIGNVNQEQKIDVKIEVDGQADNHGQIASNAEHKADVAINSDVAVDADHPRF